MFITGGPGTKGEREGHVLRAACVDESDHLALVNAGDEEVVSQEEGEGGEDDADIALRESVLFIGTPSVTLALSAFTATTVL
jgi:hypothetical protein